MSTAEQLHPNSCRYKTQPHLVHRPSKVHVSRCLVLLSQDFLNVKLWCPKSQGVSRADGWEERANTVNKTPQLQGLHIDNAGDALLSQPCATAVIQFTSKAQMNCIAESGTVFSTLYSTPYSLKKRYSKAYQLCKKLQNIQISIKTYAQ